VTDHGPDADLSQAARRGLEAQREHLVSNIGELQADDLAKTQDDNFADGGQVAAEQDEIMALATDLRAQLDDVQLALDKLDAGTYGRCEICDEPIGDERLAVMPAARYCMAHAN
jgi:RNA polymerase-binding transcription factor DksA